MRREYSPFTKMQFNEVSHIARFGNLSTRPTPWTSLIPRLTSVQSIRRRSRKLWKPDLPRRRCGSKRHAKTCLGQIRCSLYRTLKIGPRRCFLEQHGTTTNLLVSGSQVHQNIAESSVADREISMFRALPSWRVLMKSSCAGESGCIPKLLFPSSYPAQRDQWLD